MNPRPVTAPSTPMPRPPGAPTSRPATSPAAPEYIPLGGTSDSRPTDRDPTPVAAASGAPNSPATDVASTPEHAASRRVSGRRGSALSAPSGLADALGVEHRSLDGPQDRAATEDRATPAHDSSRPAISRPAAGSFTKSPGQPGGTEPAGRQTHLDARATIAAGAKLLDPTAKGQPTPTEGAPSGPGPKPAGRRPATDARTLRAAGPDPATRRASSDARGGSAGGGQTPGPAAIEPPTPDGHSLLDPALALAADIVDDLERVRIANENRLRQLTRTGLDKDGEERGFGLDPDHPDVIRLGLIILAIEGAEKEAVKNLERKMRAHPLGEWMAATRGVGLKQGARLLAAIGDPYIRPEYETAEGVVVPAGPRTVSALWAYCGLHTLPADGQSGLDAQKTSAASRGHTSGDPGRTSSDARPPGARVAARRRKGEKANWSATAKMRAYLIAESCLKQRDQDCRDGHSPSDAQARSAVPAPNHRARQRTDDAQNAYAGSVPTHPRPGGDHESRDAHLVTVAPGCGCSPYRVAYDKRRAHTAKTQPDWTDGHSHQDALRVASKAMLRDLYRAALAWHQRQESEATP